MGSASIVQCYLTQGRLCAVFQVHVLILLCIEYLKTVNLLSPPVDYYGQLSKLIEKYILVGRFPRL